MTQNQEKTVLCQICKQQKKVSEVVLGELVHDPLVETIRKKYPDWSPNGFICLSDLNHFRTEHVQEILEEDRGELSELEKEVVKSVGEQELLAKDVNTEFDKQLTIGQHVADRVAEFGGSWRFIIIFGVILLLWITGNSIVLLLKPFDPYPFILLNLVLSCLAAMQAPIIMMSQNRQEAKDRLRAEHDYAVNLKAELEIRRLNEKMDHLLAHQWQRLLEIQQIQTELMEELAHTSRQNDTGGEDEIVKDTKELSDEDDVSNATNQYLRRDPDNARR
jgi:uncharacterized membrane protein